MNINFILCFNHNPFVTSRLLLINPHSALSSFNYNILSLILFFKDYIQQDKPSTIWIEVEYSHKFFVPLIP